MSFGKKRTESVADAPAPTLSVGSDSSADDDSVLMSVPLPRALYVVLEEVAQKHAGQLVDGVPLSVSDILAKAVSLYTKDYASKSDVILNDLALEDSAIVRVTNALIVQAIENEVLEFRIPLASRPEQIKAGLPAIPSHLEPLVIRRLKMMTTPERGKFSITYEGKVYRVDVVFTSKPGEYTVADVEIVPE